MRRWLVALLWMAAFGPGLAVAAPELDRLVIVMRHGVRAPTSPPSALAKYAAEAWPDWPVAPGELTPHGANGAEIMGTWLRAHYASLLPAQGCPKSLSVWADGADERTVATAKALLDGLAPGCGISPGHGAAGQSDPVFSGIESGVCPLAQPDAKTILPALQLGLSGLSAPYKSGIDTLQAILESPGCAAGQSGCWTRGINTIRISAEGVKFKGPLATGASLAESLSLEFQQGMQGKALGWGRLDEAKLQTVMALHNLYSGIVRRNPVVAGHNGAVLANRVLATLSAEPGVPMTILVGHDTNLDNLAGIFGLDWAHPGQPDATPPDGMLVFERWRDPSATQSVKIAFVYQTAQQLRDLAPLGPKAQPGMTPIAPAYCAGGACSLTALHDQATRQIPASCGAHG